MAGKQTTATSINDEFAFGKEKTYFARLTDSSSGSHVVATVVNGKIQVFDGKLRKVIVRSPHMPQTFELQRDHQQSEQWQIWVATDGSLYRSGFTLHPEKGAMNIDADEENNQSIFDDLLKDPLPAFNDFGQPQSRHPDYVLHDIRERDRVLTDIKGLLGVACTHEVLAVLCEEESGSSVLLYRMNQFSSEESRHYIQKLSVPFSHISPERKQQCQISKLQIVLPSGSQQVESSSQMSLPFHLFSSLFGWAVSVRSLPVLLCSFTDGSVFFHTVDFTASCPESSWQLLCTVDSPPVDILTIRVSRQLTEKESVAAELQKALGMSPQAPSFSLLDAVLIVGSSGKCCLMTAVPGMGSHSAEFNRVVAVFTLPTFVKCVCWRDEILYLSSEQDVQKCTMTLVKEDRAEKWPYRVDISSESLFSASVSAMWLPAQREFLLCMTSNKGIVELDTAVSKSHENDTTSRQLQPSLKDLLLGIDISQTRLNHLKSQQQQFNTIVQQMNVAAHLLHVHRQSETNQGAVPICCKMAVKMEVSYHAVEYSVVIHVTNQCGITLTNSWSIVATLHEEDDRAGIQMGPEEAPSSHSLRLSHGLTTGQTVEIKIPLEYRKTCWGIRIKVLLALHIPTQLEGEAENKQESLQSELVIPLTDTVVDVLHCACLKQPGCTLPSIDDPWNCLQKRVKELRQASSDGGEIQQKQTNQIYTVTVKFTGEKSLCTATDVLHTVLRGGQVDTHSLAHPSCSLQAPCGSVLALSVDSVSIPSADGPGEDRQFTITAKSADISLLARARMALMRRVQKMGNIHEDVSVKDLQKMIRKTELSSFRVVHLIDSGPEDSTQDQHQSRRRRQ